MHIFAAQKEGISIQLLRRKFWRAQIAQMETFVKFLSALSKPLPSKIWGIIFNQKGLESNLQEILYAHFENYSLFFFPAK